MAISFLAMTTGRPCAECDLPFPSLAAMVRTLRQRQADRVIRRQLESVPAATLRDIGITRPEVFAGVRGDLNAVRP